MSKKMPDATFFVANVFWIAQEVAESNTRLICWGRCVLYTLRCWSVWF